MRGNTRANMFGLHLLLQSCMLVLGGFIAPQHESGFYPGPYNPQQAFASQALSQATTVPAPQPRSDMPAVARAMDSVYIFGGMDQGRNVLGDFWKFSTINSVWNEIHATNDTAPSARAWHSMAIASDWSKLYLFGGYDLAQSYDDLWRYAFATNEWKQVSPNSLKPPARDRHSMVFYQGSLIVFGGYTTAALNDVWRYATNENTWALIETSAPSSSGPAKRRSHTACVHKDQMFIFGGNNGEKTFADLWQFDFATSAWSEMGGASRPSQRSRGGLAGDHVGHLYLFGGFDGANYKYDLWRFTIGAGWEQLDPNYDRPVERADFGITFQKSSNSLDKGRLYVVGGFDGMTRLNDLFRYEVASNEWQELVIE